MNIDKNKLPKWFNGAVYTEGDTVTNPFSGEQYKLTAAQLAMYDFIMGAQMTFEMGNTDEKIINDFHKGLDWFRGTDPKGYMALLD